jgi:glycosyltransferase involved in cell wall biosynthesis
VSAEPVLPKVGVIMPARNVGPMIGNVLKSLEATTWDLIRDLVIIDNGSEDRTVECIHDFVRSNPVLGERITVLENGCNIGYGGSIKKGLRYFASSPCDFVVIVHSDDQCDHNAVIRDLTRATMRQECPDVVLGVRKSKAGPNGAGFNGYRSFGNVLITLAGRVLAGTPTRDINTPITLIRSPAIGRIPINHLTSGILFHPQLNMLFTAEATFSVAEVKVRWWDASITERRPLNRMGLAILRGFFLWCLYRRLLGREPANVLDRINAIDVPESSSHSRRKGQID